MADEEELSRVYELGIKGEECTIHDLDFYGSKWSFQIRKDDSVHCWKSSSNKDIDMVFDLRNIENEEEFKSEVRSWMTENLE